MRHDDVNTPFCTLTFVQQSCRSPEHPQLGEDDQTRVARTLARSAKEDAAAVAFSRLLQTANTMSGIHYIVVNPTGRVLSTGALAPNQPAVSTAVIGRHSQVDSQVEDASFGLRHLLVVHRETVANEVSLFDLGSDGGTSTWSGQPFTQATLSLPALVRVGSHLLAMVSSTDWHRGVRELMNLAIASRPENTTVTASTRYIFTLDDLSESTDHGMHFVPSNFSSMSAESTLRTPRSALRQSTFRPSIADLTRGVLLGRYERCTAPGDVPWDHMMSRVHAMLFAMGSSVYLADLASTNGVLHDHLGPTRLKHLEDGDLFWLGRTRLFVEAGI